MNTETSGFYFSCESHIPTLLQETMSQSGQGRKQGAEIKYCGQKYFSSPVFQFNTHISHIVGEKKNDFTLYCMPLSQELPAWGHIPTTGISDRHFSTAEQKGKGQRA